MKYLIFGAIVSLIGVWLLMTGLSLPGIIILLVGISFGVKGRNEMDRHKK